MTNEGWHDDPFHRFELRYHDGSNWTHHVSDGSGTSFVDPSGTSPFVQGPMPGPPPPGARRTDLAPAHLGLRVAALILDGVVLAVPFTILILLTMDWDQIEAGTTPDISPAFYIGSIVVSTTYYIVMVGRWGRTVGKMATGLTIVRASTGDAPGYRVATVRAFAFLLYSIPYLVGVLVFIASVIMVLASPWRQAIHDKVAGTVVVRAAT